MLSYFTIVIARTVPQFTNDWNQVPSDWPSLTRGTFVSELSACEWARDHLLHGAPFTVKFVPVESV